MTAIISYIYAVNIIFIVCIAASIALCGISNPESLVSALEAGASSAVSLALKLAAVYAVWLGFFRVLEDSGLTVGLARALKKPLRGIFGDTGKAEAPLSTCIAANLVGIGAIATKSGLEAMSLMDAADNEYAKSMLFVVSATSIQLLPVSVVTLRAAFGSVSPSDVILPSLISTAISTFIGIMLVKIFIKR